MRVELDGISPNDVARAVFDEGSYPFYPVGPNSQRALIAIPRFTTPDEYALRIDTRKGQPARWVKAAEQTIIVSSRTFPVEEVVFTPEVNALKRYERVEGARIHHVLRTLSREQLWEGAFDRPVDGEIEGVYGSQRRTHGVLEEDFHKGEDLKAPQGTPIRAVNGGVVMMAAHLKAHGRIVVLNHGQGVMSLYLHMSAITVKPGQHVAKGQKIGLVGSTGLSTGPHVHWGIYIHSVPVDPVAWVETEY